MIDREITDVESAFLVYATLAGNTTKTAHALGVTEKAVLAVATDENWDGKLKPIIELARSQSPGSLERACNRAINFSQVHRLRILLERLLRNLTQMSDEELRCQMVEEVSGKDGSKRSKLTTRAFTDLCKAIESCHAGTYLALADLASDRAKRAEEKGADSVVDLHAAIALSMSRAGASNSPRVQLFTAQLETAKEIAEAAKKPESPYDKEV